MNPSYVPSPASANAKNIDYFNDFVLTMRSAESIHVYEVCKHFQKLSCNVRLFSPSSPGMANPGFRYVRIRTPRFLVSPFYQLMLIPSVIFKCSKLKPDLVYVRVSPMLIMPLLLAKLYRIPVVVEINGTLLEELSKSGSILSRILIKSHFSDFVERTSYRSADLTITVTNRLKLYIVNKFKVDPAKVKVVENGVDAEALKPKRARQSKDHLVIGYVGGLMPWQGLEYVISAMQRVVRTHPKAELVIAGDGPDLANLKVKAKQSGVAKHVNFIGSVSHDKVPELINSFDICIAYYIKKRSGLTSPFKIYEYLSCGRPTIVSNIRGVGDVFADVACAIEPENPTKLADAIIALIDDPRQRHDLSKKARQYIVDGHTWLEVTKNILSEVNKIKRS